VESKEGAGGGMRLAKDPHRIGITEVIEIFQGKIELSDCMFRRKICENRKTCVLRKEIKRIERVVVDEFSRISIGNLLGKIDTGKEEPDACGSRAG
jgi:DNA-binding IscR family transcriptional regulator